MRYGFTCLWACEVNRAAMDYRDLRREFGVDLRLIGGIDLDALRRGRNAIREELTTRLPPLLAQGGYVPLADGRIREKVRYADYCYYRRLLHELVSSTAASDFSRLGPCAGIGCALSWQAGGRGIAYSHPGIAG